VENLTQSFPGISEMEIREIAKEHFRRLGENYISAIKTADMTTQQMQPHFEFIGTEKILPFEITPASQNRVVAIGHFGNFELYARSAKFIPAFRFATTYRGLKQPALNRLLLELRNRADCDFYERRTECDGLKAALNKSGIFLGLLADQHAGSNGLRLPFLGRDCSTSAAPAVLALRYDCPLHTAICYRVGPARWRVEVGEEILTRINGEPRFPEDIMRDVNTVFEAAVRRDPANWFWVHRRWKPVQKIARAKNESWSRPPNRGIKIALHDKNSLNSI
jgi:lauroyl/myristoyl acyltransferase